MAGLNVRLTGMKELQKRIAKAAKSVPGEVDAEVSQSVDRMRLKALQEAPADQGLLRAEIQGERKAPMNHGLFSNALYSGYIEFGTRRRVKVPPGLEDVASQIKGAVSSSLKARDAIYAWCKRKGIDKERWESIFLSIMTNGIKPHPFFFKQLEADTPVLLKNLENILNKI